MAQELVQVEDLPRQAAPLKSSPVSARLLKKDSLVRAPAIALETNLFCPRMPRCLDTSVSKISLRAQLVPQLRKGAGRPPIDDMHHLKFRRG